MMLSNHTHIVKIEENNYAVFNNLIMDVYYVDGEELRGIQSFSVKKDQETCLLASGIYVSDGTKDNQAEQVLLKRLEKSIGRMDILYLILTNNCNLKCNYCFLDNNPNNMHFNGTMTRDVAKTAIRKFYSHTIKHHIANPMLLFYGGEPLLCKELFYDCIAFSQELSTTWRYSIITNGTLVDNQFVEICKRYHINVGISIDGPKWIHDKNRLYRQNRRPTYDDCIKSIQLLNTKKVPYSISLVVSNAIINHKEELLTWLKENGIKDIYFNLLHFNSFSHEYEQYGIQMPSFYTSFYDLCLEERISEGRIERQIDSLGKQQFVFSDCGAVGCHQITVLPDGNLTICHGDSVEMSHSLGSVFNFDFDNIITTDEGKFWSSISTLYRAECLVCEALFVCGGGCPHHAGNVFGDRRHMDDNYCSYIKSVLLWLLKKGLTEEEVKK